MFMLHSLVLYIFQSNKMIKLKFYWVYFKSTIVLNLSSSVLLSSIIMSGLINLPDPPPFHEIYIFCCMFGGPFICFFYKELSRKEEYYFYFNRGITKLSLIIMTLLTYIIIGLILLIILHHVKLA